MQPPSTWLCLPHPLHWCRLGLARHLWYQRWLWVVCAGRPRTRCSCLWQHLQLEPPRSHLQLEPPRSHLQLEPPRSHLPLEPPVAIEWATCSRQPQAPGALGQQQLAIGISSLPVQRLGQRPPLPLLAYHRSFCPQCYHQGLNPRWQQLPGRRPHQPSPSPRPQVKAASIMVGR